MADLSSYIKENLLMASNSLSSNKLRSLLTTLGIIIGVMTVISILSLIEGMNKSVAKEIESIGPNLISVNRYEWKIGRRRRRGEKRRPPFKMRDLEAIQECPAIESACPEIYERQKVKYLDKNTSIMQITGTTHLFAFCRTVTTKYGRFISELDYEYAKSVCVIGLPIAETLFPHLNPIDKEVRIGAHKFRVIGVLEEKGGSFLGDQDNIVLIPISTFFKYFGGDNRHRRFTGNTTLNFNAIPTSTKTKELALDQMTFALRRSRKLKAGEPNNFALNTQDTLGDMYKQITGGAFIIMIVIAGISLLVGGIGIMNIMLVSVTERTREIGIRKAIGAKRKDILIQFLIEATILSLFGGIIGIGLGIGIAHFVAAVTPLDVAVPLWTVILGFSVSVIIGIVCGIYPAAKASKLDPISALRYE